MQAHGKITNIGFISTRFQGTDGVSLETAKWSTVLERMNYRCFFFSGLSDWDTNRSVVVPEAFFDYPEIQRLQDKCFGSLTRTSELTGEIHRYRLLLKEKLYDFIHRNKIDLIIPENTLTIPMNVPLGLALTEIIAETGIPTIAHHHDFFWERQRFSVTSIPDFLSMAFPPKLPSIQNVVINTPADTELSFRTGISAHVIPNVLNFSKPAPGFDDYNKDVRVDLGLEENDLFILQPTRIVARKGIEHAIEICNRLKDKRVKLVITHSAGDEGYTYENRIQEYARLMDVPLIIKPEIIDQKRGVTADGRKKYTLWDIYPHADLITYPSVYEGFGNAFLEAVYFKKPILVNRYSIYEVDIEPRGFDVITMDGYVTDDVIHQIKRVLYDEERIKSMVETNYRIASKFFSYEVLEFQLRNLLISFEGLD